MIAAVKATQGGISVDTLARPFPQLPRRTWQRRLARLVADKRLCAEGRGPPRCYHPPVAWPTAVQSVTASYDDAAGQPLVEDYVPLSATGRELRALVRRPLAQRTSVV